MARDHARIRLDIWQDDDFRDLCSQSQWLYFFLLTSPSLSFAGVVDWRPARIADHTSEMCADDVEYAAAELEAGLFIIIDRDAEECLIRSFVKHDGLMKSPNMAKALGKDYTRTTSRTLRAVIVHQLLHLQDNDPDLKGWPAIDDDVLGRRSMSPEDAFALLPRNPSLNPSANPSANPFERGSVNPSATPLLLNSLPPVLPDSLTPFTSKPKAQRSTHQGHTDLGLEAS